MEYARCLGRLQRLCSRAEYCSGDIFRKALKDLEGDSEAASRVVAALVADRYVDDARYAAAFTREKALLQGWGPVKIRFQLRAKGVPDAVIDDALSSIEQEDSDDRLCRLMAAKAKSLAGDPQIRQKLLRFALGRGYSYDAASTALERCL